MMKNRNIHLSVAVTNLIVCYCLFQPWVKHQTRYVSEHQVSNSDSSVRGWLEDIIYINYESSMQERQSKEDRIKVNKITSGTEMKMIVYFE